MCKCIYCLYACVCVYASMCQWTYTPVCKQYVYMYESMYI